MTKASSLTRLVLITLSVQMLGACVTTRSAMKEQEEKQVIRNQVTTLQKTSADVNNRFQDIEDSIRRLTGRIEVMEANQKTSASNITKNELGLENKINENNAAYREEFAKLQTEIETLRTQFVAANEARAKAEQAAESERKSKAESAAKEAAKDPFEIADDKFDAKNWKEAILDYERYRNTYPKGKKFAAATLKIGISFQELGMGDEAKSFYEEVISKFPKTKEAGQAQSKLKAMKKKG